MRADRGTPAALAPRELAAALAVVTIWGLNFVAIKHALLDFTPFQLGLLRFFFGAVPLVLFVRPPALRWGWVVAVGLTQFGQFALLFVALRLGMTAALASVLMQTQVFFTVLLGVLLLHESIGAVLRVSLALAALGLCCFGLNLWTDAATGGVTLSGLLLCLCGALMWAAGNVATRLAQAAQPGYAPLPFVAWMSLVPIAPFAALSWCFDPVAARTQWLQASAGAWLSAVYLGFFATAFAYALWTWLLTRHPANRVAPFSLGVPVVGLSAGMLLLGELVSAWQWAGIACVFAALAVLMFAGRLQRWRLARRP